MKISVSQAVAICNILGSVSQSDIEELSEKIVSCYLSLLPLCREYNDALGVLQKEAQGKEQEEVMTLVSAKAFESIATKEIDVDIPTLTMAELKQLGGKIKDFKLSYYQVLMPIVKEEN